MGYSAFQIASINKICNHFEQHSRVICADEAGLGKTYIARGVIEQMADKKLHDLLDEKLIQECEEWWENSFIEQKFRDFPGSGPDNAKERVKKFGKAVTGNNQWDLNPRETFKGAMKRIVGEEFKNLPLASKKELWFLVIKNLSNLLIAYNKTKSNLERKEDWDFSICDCFPDTLKQNSFRVLYICSNLAIAEQNTSRLIDCRQRSIRKGDKPDRLSTVWYYQDKYYTPYVELYPVSYTLAKSDTKGTDKEREVLGGLCNVDLKGVDLSNDSKGIKCRNEGENKSLDINYDLIIFDEFQNFGDAIAFINHDNNKEQILKDMENSSNKNIKAKALIKRKLYNICKALYSEKNKSQKTLLLSATPFKDIAVSRNEFSHLSLSDILLFLGGDITTYSNCENAKTKIDYLYSIGIFRNERKNMISSYSPLILPIPCTSQGVITQATLMCGEGQGNKGVELIKYAPEAIIELNNSVYSGLNYRPYNSIATEFSYDFDRFNKCKNLVFSPEAIVNSDMGETYNFNVNDLAKLLWIPPTKPSRPLDGIFHEYAKFSKSFIFTKDLEAIPIQLTDKFNSAVKYCGCNLADEDELKEKLKERYFADSPTIVDDFVEMIKSCGGKAFSSNAVSTEDVLNYCEQGCLDDVLVEFTYLYGLESKNALQKIFDFMKNNYSFAMKLDEQAISAEDKGPTMRRNFNSPFMPFVLTTTSIGSEGIDFHLYCDRLIHYCLPKNFIDWEQKNGRIDRRDSLAVRRWWAKPENLWQLLEREKIENDSGGLSPHWDSGNGGLHYYYLYVKDSEEEQDFENLHTHVRENRMVLGSDGITLQIQEGELVNLSPYLREKM